ncbi:Short chain dehydrogenase, partial [Lachnellula occidentalis]
GQMSKSALVFGASGVSGWAFVNEMLHDYPKIGTWEKVHALTNRPLKHSDSLWLDDDRLNIVSGIDLLKGSQEDVEAALRSIDGIKNVTHVFYLAYKASADLDQEFKDAESMFRRSTTAMDHLSPALEFVVLQIGAKIYGCHLLENHPADYIPVPLKESHPRIKSPYAEKLFYHAQLDWITEYAKDKQWNWCDTRPDVIIGFVPNQNFYSMASSIGVFLSLWAEVEGKGSTVSYPGTEAAWVAKSNDSSSDMIARQTLYLSTTLPKSQKGEGFNVADAKEPESWETKWPIICSYFGLKGTGPPAEGASNEVRTYIKQNIGTWKTMEKKYGLKIGIADSELTLKGFEYHLLTHFDFDRQYDMTKMYSTGFKEERNTKQAWGGVFDRMKVAKIIPS